MNYNLSHAHKLYILLLIIVLIIILYKLYTKSIDQIEHFESVLSRLRSSKKDKKDNTKVNKTNKSETFDNIMKRSEEFKKRKDTMGDFMSSFTKFKNSFTTEKFKNNSKSTGEALKKFFEIFE